MLIARIVHNLARLARAAARVAAAPRRALLKPLDGLPIRVDVINKNAALTSRSRVRNVYSHANAVALVARALFAGGRSARRIEAAEAVREQPVCAALVYLLTYRGGSRALARNPASEPMHEPRDRGSRGAPPKGVRGSRVISAFAGDQDVTRHVKLIEGGAEFPDTGFADLRHYLVAVCGADPAFDDITIVFANMEQKVLTPSSSGPWTACDPRPGR